MGTGMIFLYHSVVPDDSPNERLCAGQALTQSVFETQILWLANRYRIVSLAEYLASSQRQGPNMKKLAAITLDDGFRLTFECIFPFLLKNNFPVTIFVTTGHLEHGDLLWFSYLKALCFENTYGMLKIARHIFPLQYLPQRIRAWNHLHALAKASGNPVKFCKDLARNYPLDPDIIPLYAGMTHHQLETASAGNLVEVGAHTLTHPYLGQLTKEEQEQEIVESGRILSKLTGKPVRYFAYPSGEYDLDTLDLVKNAGYDTAFAVVPKNLGVDHDRFQIGRIGIYSPSLLKLQLKALGVANLARSFGLRVG
jgi:peptidoglycan/xylan/chitin deacetylase (PgdA/CDA1 family)